jgi:hypothetical protein
MSNGLKFPPAPAPSIFPHAPSPQYFAATDRFRRRAFSSPPPRRRSASPAPPPGTLVPRRRPALLLRAVPPAVAPRHRLTPSPETPLALSTPPSPWRRAYCQHGAAKTLAGLLARYAPPPATIIFSHFFPTR